ncbi:MAG: acyl-CoA/acyl-ACP dehydrogenase [Halieaceae bacterium]|jgi:alkylation response protein AidB-like acyl-CoA dehydrogenase|nr:acyl-CoA/acyl-ACP dehydrogenase [Halieaceae bacterium]
MDFELSAEQVAMRDVARNMLGERWHPDKMREAIDKPPATIPTDLWAELSQMGWLGVNCDEILGGGGQDILTAAILVEEAGRALLPSTFSTNLASAWAIENSANQAHRDGLLTELVLGNKRVTLAIEENHGSWGPDTIELNATGNDRDDTLHLSGTKLLVPDGSTADLFLVAARHDENLCLVAVDADAQGVTVNAMKRLDGADIVELELNDVAVPASALLQWGGDGESLLREVYSVFTVLIAADLLGSAEVTLQMTSDYAKERVQFGQPIGSFQAVSHRLADILVQVEIGRSLLYGACLALTEQREERHALVAAAKSWLNETAIDATEAGVQLHGGIGYSWELDVHLHLRRARSNAATLGDSDFHRDQIANYYCDRPG